MIKEECSYIDVYYGGTGSRVVCCLKGLLSLQRNSGAAAEGE